MIDLYTSAELKAKWEEWKKYRTSEKRQKGYTESGENRAINRLKRLSNGDESVAMQILDEAMELQYIGFFALKTKPNGQQPINTSNPTSPSGTSSNRLNALGNW